MASSGEPKRSASEWTKDVHAEYGGALPPFIKDYGQASPKGRRRGRGALEIKEVVLGDPTEERTMIDGSLVTMGVPLREVREILGGDEGEIEHPATGDLMTVSLRAWEGRDPETTLLQLKFTFVSHSGGDA